MNVKVAKNVWLSFARDDRDRDVAVVARGKALRTDRVSVAALLMAVKL